MKMGEHELVGAFSAVSSRIGKTTDYNSIQSLLRSLKPSRLQWPIIQWPIRRRTFPDRAFVRFVTVLRLMAESKEDDSGSHWSATRQAVKKLIASYDDKVNGHYQKRKYNLLRGLSEIFGKKSSISDLCKLRNLAGFDLFVLQFTLSNFSDYCIRVLILMLFIVGSFISITPTILTVLGILAKSYDKL